MLETLISNNTEASYVPGFVNAAPVRSLNGLNLDSKWGLPTNDSRSSAPSFVLIKYADQLQVDPNPISRTISSKFGWQVWPHEAGRGSEDGMTFLVADVARMLNRDTAAASRGCIYGRSAGKGWLRTLERIVNDLGRLTADWDGPGSVIPSDRVIADLETALRCLPSSTDEPEIEADSSDGSVALTWTMQDRRVTATFVGNGKMFVFISDKAGRRSKSASINDDVHIQELMCQALALQVSQLA